MAKNRKVKTFFETLNSANRYAILFRIRTAKKAETRARRIEQFIGVLERHENIHPRAGITPASRRNIRRGAQVVNMTRMDEYYVPPRHTAVNERLDCERAVTGRAQNLEEHRGGVPRI